MKDQTQPVKVTDLTAEDCQDTDLLVEKCDEDSATLLRAAIEAVRRSSVGQE